MNNAIVSKSKRLQRVLDALERYSLISSWELMQVARVVSPGTCVSELRQQGYIVSCSKQNGVFIYQLIGKPITSS